MAEQAPDLKQQVQDLIAGNEVMLFMKGVPEAPRCGFSMRVVQVLERYGVEYGAVDVLQALEPLREITGELYDWRTFPQLYVKGDLVGGCDIVEELDASGELAQILGATPRDTAAPSTEPAPGEPGYTSPPMGIENS
jgi:monothiol glutaredoxin